MSLTIRILVLALAALGLQRTADGATVTLQWDSNREQDVAGYLVSYGTQSGQLTTTADAGNHTSYQLSELETGRTYFFAIRAYNTAGLISAPSNEVSVAIGTAPLSLPNFMTSLTSPQPAGSTVILAAAASGGTAPYQYKWSIWDGATLIMVRDWSGDNTLRWQPVVASQNYLIRVWARSATNNSGTAERSMQFAITPGAGDSTYVPPPPVRWSERSR